MIVVTECMYSHTECVFVYTYVKDTFFSVYCYIYMYSCIFYSDMVAPSCHPLWYLCSRVCMLLCAFVCVREKCSQISQN